MWPKGTLLTRIEVGRTGSGEQTDYGRIQFRRYDAMGYLVGVERRETPGIAPESVLSFVNDTAGNRLVSRDVIGRKLQFAYDDLDRLLTITNDANAVTHFAYDPFGNRQQVTDAENRVTRFDHDALDRLTQVTVEGVNQEPTGFHYDAAGNVTRVTDPRQHTTVYQYDPLSRLRTVTPPLGANYAVSYCYDDRDRLTGVVNARGKGIDYHYYDWGGLQNVEQHTGSEACGNSQGTIDNTVSYTYYDNGNEPPRVCWRLHFLRGWSHVTTEPVFARGA